MKRKIFNINDLKKFYNISGRLPRNVKGESGLYQWMRRKRKSGDKEVSEFLEEIGYGYKEQRPNHTLSELKEFFVSNGRLPKQRIKEERSLYEWMSRKRRKGNKEVIGFIEKINAILCIAKEGV